MAGGLSLVPSANIGTRAATFEPAHGTVADLASQNFANPTAILLSGIMMLRHIGAFKAASQIEHALYVTLEEGRYVTPDLAVTYPCVSTDTFVKAVIDNLGEASAPVVERDLDFIQMPTAPVKNTSSIARSFDGLDVFIEWDGSVDMLASKLNLAMAGKPFALETLSNRGHAAVPFRERERRTGQSLVLPLQLYRQQEKEWPAAGHLHTARNRRQDRQLDAHRTLAEFQRKTGLHVRVVKRIRNR
jgi:isocitrate dehydrogenase